jgi:hypothetical protein
MEQHVDKNQQQVVFNVLVGEFLASVLRSVKLTLGGLDVRIG